MLLEDRENVTEGTLMLDELPSTDEELIDASVSFLKEIGWWRNGTILLGLSHTIDCPHADPLPDEIRLTFVREQRESLLQSIDYRAKIVVNINSGQVEYELIDGISNLYAGVGPGKTYRELNLDLVKIGRDCRIIPR